MKLNLLLSSDDILGGFINLDEYPIIKNKDQAFTTEKKKGSVRNLDHIADTGEVEQIVANDVIDFIDPDKKGGVIQGWCKKLAYGGTISIGGVDLWEVSKGYSGFGLSDEQVSSLLFGNPGFPFGYRRGVCNGQNIRDILQNCGLKVTRHMVDNYRYNITAKRPEL